VASRPLPERGRPTTSTPPSSRCVGCERTLTQSLPNVPRPSASAGGQPVWSPL
jgi:hypothetical protein